MTVHWTEAALADLHAVEVYIGRHSPQYARAMIERIFARSGALADHPRLGPRSRSSGTMTLRELFEDPYRIVYRVLAEQIDIVAIVHAARRLPRGL
jgi:plasmid stabilization system protein ParE